MLNLRALTLTFPDIAPLTINTDGSVVTIDGEKVQTDSILLETILLSQQQVL